MATIKQILKAARLQNKALAAGAAAVSAVKTFSKEEAIAVATLAASGNDKVRQVRKTRKVHVKHDESPKRVYPKGRRPVSVTEEE